MRQIKSRLTYANLVSTLALFLVLGGAGAYAAKKNTKKIGTTQIKASAITEAKLKNGAVSNLKLQDSSVSNSKLQDGSVSNSKLQDDSVSTSKLQGDSVTGEKVSEATLGEVPSAASANPVAFAKVGSNGVVDASSSKALTSANVTHPGTGTYCVTVPSFAPRGGQVTTQSGGAGGSTAQISTGGAAGCPAAAVGVLTWSAAGVAVDVGFYVELYR
jgi:hypothetical protein